jgi:regulator of RNase E activity RraA
MTSGSRPARPEATDFGPSSTSSRPVKAPSRSGAWGRGIFLSLMAGMLVAPTLGAQQISQEELIFLTPEWEGERFDDGRPHVPDDILERMKLVTIEEAWAVLNGERFKYAYEGDWLVINPDSVLVGRAVTATFVPGRPDIHRAIDQRGRASGQFSGAQNTWVLDLLQPGDVYVVDQFGATVDGPTIGDNLGNSIYALTGNTSYVRSYHPSHHNPGGNLNTTLVGINQPTRIGMATVMPGDVVLARDGGVIFVPPHLAERVVTTSEIVRLRDMFGHERLREGVYTAGQIDTRWAEEIERDFSQWLRDHIDELPVAPEHVQEYLETRTW